MFATCAVPPLFAVVSGFSACSAGRACRLRDADVEVETDTAWDLSCGEGRVDESRDFARWVTVALPRNDSGRVVP